MEINTSFSIWTELLSRVPYGSVLGPLLLNTVAINDLIFLRESLNMYSYADDTTFHVCDLNLEFC